MEPMRTEFYEDSKIRNAYFFLLCSIASCIISLAFHTIVHAEIEIQKTLSED